MTDVCHLSLAYFGDFRLERNTDNELVQYKVDIAYEELHGQEISFEIDGCPFQVVSTSQEFNKIDTKANLAFAPVVGNGRDAILSLLPGKAIQDMFSKKVSCVFGENFKLWNSQKKEVPFHVTIAQTDKLNSILANVKDHSEKTDDLSTLSI